MKIIGIGEVVWDCFPEGKRLGGAPINFCFFAKELGAESYPVTAIGDDELGDETFAVLKEKMESSINLIGSYLGQKKAPTSGAGTYRIISSGTSGNANGTGDARSRKASPEEIRAAMGLKGRK